MKSALVAMRGIGLLLMSNTTLAMPWSKDMGDQVSVKAQESVVHLPAHAVARNASRLQPPDMPLGQQREWAAVHLQNPLALSAESVARGRVVFMRVCAACHGLRGHGDGQVGLRFTPRPMDLTLDYVHDQPEGRLFFTITHGSAVMPAYGDALLPDDRWHLIHYLQHGLRNP